MAEESNAPFLPEEIMRNILKRLPVKSLIRFQCVCKHWRNLFRAKKKKKHWRNLFKTPSFVADRLHHASPQNPSLLLEMNIRPLHLRLTDCEMHFLEVQNPHLFDSFPDVKIFGSCNGLLIVAIDESVDESDIESGEVSEMCSSSLFLWNPAIREFKQISRTETFEFPEWDLPECECAVGFGFSAIVNDYKIVRIFACLEGVVSRVELYSLSTDSWKEIECGSLEGFRILGHPVTANGAFFWCGENGEADEDVIDLIVSFDIAMEVFNLIPRPPVPPLSGRSQPQFTVYEDKFAVLSLSRIGDSPNYLYSLIDLWVLEEDVDSSTERWNWTKKYTSNPCPPMLDVLTIWKNEIVCVDLGMVRTNHKSGDEMETDEQRSFLLYLINFSTNGLDVCVISRCGYLFSIFNHVESLVPVEFEEP